MGDRIMGYFCNCEELALKNGKKVDKARGYNYVKYFKTEVDKEEICVYCGYYAVFSHVDPNESTGTGMTRMIEGDIKWKTRLRLRS